MQVNGTGSSSTYIYNAKTGKLSTKDGSADDFVDYFNGDLTDNPASTLNGFDKRKKSDLNAMLMFFQSGHKGIKDIFHGQDGDEYEITCNIEDAVTTQFSVNGENVFKAYDMNVFTYIDAAEVSSALYQTLQSRAYGMSDNSIQFAVGDVIDLGNGYSLKVEEGHIRIDGLGSGSKEQDHKARQLAYGLDAFIRFAGKQWMPDKIDQETTPMLLCLLRELGVDTDRTFQVNGTKCEVRNDRITEAGNRFAVPHNVYQEALKRYEEALATPIS